MNHDALLRETARLEQELGPCLLLVKCYELLGRRSDDARTMAAAVLRGELERLGRILEQGFGFRQRSEQFLRAIYALSVAGHGVHAVSTLSRLLLDAKEVVRGSGLFEGEDAFRVAIGPTLLLSQNEDLSELLAPGSLAAHLARSWRANSPEDLQDFADRIDDLIEAAENEGISSPCGDGWLYILQLRLSTRLGRERK